MASLNPVLAVTFLDNFFETWLQRSLSWSKHKTHTVVCLRTAFQDLQIFGESVDVPKSVRDSLGQPHHPSTNLHTISRSLWWYIVRQQLQIVNDIDR
ncbi:hypothetical protein J6590_085310 [Homalodisca vitripennis]|nr:hypothetical protein J6590_085310 [Homalodisca vitripennis]